MSDTTHVSRPLATNSGSAYLAGNYAPVADEVTAFDLPVIGELPTELEGRYLRNGPNPAEPVDPTTHHWFVGDGMVHGIRLRDGRAEWYRNRYVGLVARSARCAGSPTSPGRTGTTAGSARTRTSAGSPARRGRWSRPAAARSS